MGIVDYLLDHKVDVAAYSGLLFVSWQAVIITSRLFFHPLSNIPGPKIAAVSRLYEFYWDSIQHGRLWAQFPRLHDRYGPIIRISPNEVHIADTEFFDTLIGFNTLKKEAMVAKQYGLSHALFATEDYKTYTRKRAAFGDAFSRNKALQLKEMIEDRIDRACDLIRDYGEKGETVDLAYIYRATPAEIVTQFLFGEDYGFLEDKVTTAGLTDKRFDTVFGLTNLGRFIPFWIPLLSSLLRQQAKALLGFKEPGMAFLSFFKFANGLVQKTKARLNEGESSDVRHPVMFEVLLNQKSLNDAEKTDSALAQHAMTIWSGGWDTVGFSLTAGTYAVLRNEEVLRRLQEELKSAWPNPDVHPPMSTLDELPYLNAVLKETFRLAPGALCRLTRINETEATQYKQHSLPAGTHMSTSIPMVLHDPAIWGDDHGIFRPERWLEDGSEELDKHLVTFSKGTRICPGIELTWVEFRLIIGTLFRRFDMHIPDEAGIVDEDIYPYYEGFTPIPKNKKHFLPVKVSSLK